MLQKLRNKLLNPGLYLAVIIGLVFWIGWGQAIFRPIPQPAPLRQWKTDTVYVAKPAPIIKLERVSDKPKKLEIFTKPDTARRQAMEKQPIIAGLQFKSTQLQVQKLLPNGTVQVASYPIRDLALTAITVDSVGNVNVAVDQKELRRQHRRKMWRKIGNGALVAVAFAGGLLL